MKERRPSLTLGPQQQQTASNPQQQLHNQQQQHFNMLQQPNIVQQLSALQQQQHPLPAGAVTSAIDYTPLKVSCHLNCEIHFITNGLFALCFCVELMVAC